MLKVLQAILLSMPALLHAADSLDLKVYDLDRLQGCESQIVFSAEGAFRKLFVVNSDGTGLREIKDVAITGEFGSDLSPDGLHFGFIGGINDSPPFVVNTDGTGLRQLVDTAEYRYFGLKWSPDGRWTLSTALKNADESDTDEIHLIDVATSTVFPFRLPESHEIIGFDWSPDGKHIVYSDLQERYSNPQSDIYILSVDSLLKGEQVTPINITSNEARSEAPDWSPQGDKIAFASNRDGNLDIYVMNEDGTEVMNLTLDDKDNYNPLWSPDGEKIAYQRRIDYSNNELYVVNIAEPGSQSSMSPSAGAFDWSPDGNHIALSTNEIPDDSLHIVDIHTGNITDLIGLIGDTINDDDLYSITGVDWSPCLT